MYQRSSKSIKCHNSMLILGILSLWWQCSWAYSKWGTTNDVRLNPNIPCPGMNQPNIWQPCKYGGYIENHDPRNCADRYICYVGLDEKCNYGVDKCADGAMCTVCGICQKCESREKCSDFRLCPGLPKMDVIKRFMQKRLIEYNDEYDE